MKKNFFSAITLTVLTIILFSGVYTSVVWAIAQISPNRGEGEIVLIDGKKYYTNIGQSFTVDKYFYSRPSAVDYNAAGSAGSNKGPSNPEYLATVQARIDTLLKHNPGIQKADIPVDLVTASGSGLDPNISVKAAQVQIQRIARIRGIAPEKIASLIANHTEKPVLGMLGPEKINVLKLNLALDHIQ
ncbi:K(+)-transporting ATPase subunit C [Olivibacter sp. SA151]|uniref:K(+)-transporting ATPase subunit C n=1 Tax=Olivibacter jilunii TaxID=985016 RepID=UPI003F14AB71